VANTQHTVKGKHANSSSLNFATFIGSRQEEKILLAERQQAWSEFNLFLKPGKLLFEILVHSDPVKPNERLRNTLQQNKK
jgi:hypothetical protein